MKIQHHLIVFLALIILLALPLFSWTPPKRLTWNTGDSAYPAVAVNSAKNIHIVWVDDVSGNMEIYYRKSLDSGATWSAIKRLTWNAGYSSVPRIAIDSSDNIHIVWMDDSPGNPEIYYKCSTDNGTSWSSPQRVTWNLTPSGYPDIACDTTNRAHIVWDEYFPTTLSRQDNKDLFIPSGNRDIFYKNVSGGGTSWSTVKRLSWNSAESRNVKIGAYGNNMLHVVWRDSNYGNDEIFYKRSSDGGTTFSGINRLTYNLGQSTLPDIAVDLHHGVHVVWGDYSFGNSEICYKYSSGGISWSALKRLTWNTDASYTPCIDTTTVNTTVHISVVWINIIQGNIDLFHKSSTMNGSTWGASERLTWTTSVDYSPVIAFEQSALGLNVLWYAWIASSNEIFYKRNN